MNHKRLIGGVAQKKMCGFLQSAAGVEQFVFPRNFNLHPELIVRLQILDYHSAK